MPGLAHIVVVVLVALILGLIVGAAFVGEAGFITFLVVLLLGLIAPVGKGLR